MVHPPSVRCGGASHFAFGAMDSGDEMVAQWVLPSPNEYVWKLEDIQLAFVFTGYNNQSPNVAGDVQFNCSHPALPTEGATIADLAGIVPNSVPFSTVHTINQTGNNANNWWLATRDQYLSGLGHIAHLVPHYDPKRFSTEWIYGTNCPVMHSHVQGDVTGAIGLQVHYAIRLLGWPFTARRLASMRIPQLYQID